MADTPTLKFYNTLAREKQVFEPIDAQNVRLYVCGPTVYDYAHIGNARPAIVFDVLFRLLRHVYGENHVTYVRNITDVDDKINARALRDFPDLKLNDAIRRVTEKTETQYVADVATLGCLNPTVQPRATENIDGMIGIAQSLIDRGHAYVATGPEGREVLFSVPSMEHYGELSKRKLEDQQAGARIAVEAHKKSPADFVLWKESAADQPGWDASFTVDGETVAIYGRPGWHIECSAMSDRFLWEEIKDKLSPKAKARPHQFDIHGGGLDLIFPHHENEIAQSCCAFDTGVMANIWMHNGFLQVEGRKMSKSEGNFVTINELLETEKFGGRKWPGEVLRLAMLMTHYREPIDFSVKRLEEAEALLRKWHAGLEAQGPVHPSVLDALSDDLNTVAAIQALHALAATNTPEFAASAALLGVLPKKVSVSDALAESVEALVQLRLEMLKVKNFAEADRLRDQLASQGIQLKDSKDSTTGERVTTWEVKR
ncbi:MAG TPA: cysteine--tRNA ligase [Ensifer sp.]|nr:cysteine--tRNA ligase [Ensifer sp.]